MRWSTYVVTVLAIVVAQEFSSQQQKQSLPASRKVVSKAVQHRVSSKPSDRSPYLPKGNILLAYETKCDVERVVRRAIDGINVIVWFSSNLIASPNPDYGSKGEAKIPKISFSQEGKLQCISDVVNTLEKLNLTTAHLMCIGGWDAPHPDPSFDGLEYFEAFEHWNQAIGNKYKFRGFDGVDWDLEGNDNVKSIYNTFSRQTLDIVEDFSTQAKAVGGYIMSLVPPESYFEPIYISQFNRAVNNTPIVPGWHPEFTYVGRNVYTYWLAKCTEGTFDLINIQLYESWSYTGYATERLGMTMDEFIFVFVMQYQNAKTLWVRFSQDPTLAAELPDMDIKDTFSFSKQVTLGFSFGDKFGKSVFAYPDAVAKAWKRLGYNAPRGLFFWNLNSDPNPNANGREGNYVDLTKGFSEFLNTRKGINNATVSIKAALLRNADGNMIFS